jgi:hypothetical protein
MRTLIFSHLYHRPGSPPAPLAALLATLDMWLDHLRGPGRYTGDVLLFTNVTGIERPELIVRPFENVPADARQAYLHRVLSYREVPVQNYDVAMQMDLDLLTVDDINPLFPQDTRLWAARRGDARLASRLDAAAALGARTAQAFQVAHERARRIGVRRGVRGVHLGQKFWSLGPGDP